MKDIILLVEDDPQQSASIKAAVERHWRNADVELLETESDFYSRATAIAVAGAKPRMVICDVMIPWAFPDPDAPKAPPEVQEGTFRKGGLRCWKRFRQIEEFRQVPWIYFTVLDEKTIGFEEHSDERTGYVQKAGSIEPLLEEIDEYLHMDDQWEESDEQVTKKLTASPKMRKILLDGLNIPLADCSPLLP
jgi:CheY-like chemotaxis protein